jgi:hypothetical protein
LGVKPSLGSSVEQPENLHLAVPASTPAWALPVPARNTPPQHFVVNDQPSGLHIVTREPFLPLEQVRHDALYPAQKLKHTTADIPGCG